MNTVYYFQQVIILYQTWCSVVTFADKCFDLLDVSQEGRHFLDCVVFWFYFIQVHSRSIFKCLFYWACIISREGGTVSSMRTMEFLVPCYFHPLIKYSPIYADSSAGNECSFLMQVAVKKACSGFQTLWTDKLRLIDQPGYATTWLLYLSINRRLRV